VVTSLAVKSVADDIVWDGKAVKTPWDIDLHGMIWLRCSFPSEVMGERKASMACEEININFIFLHKK
jgi:hypothetical protein